MERINYLKIIKHEWRVILFITVLAVALSLVLSLVQPLRYSSSVKLLIIHKTGFGLDPYTAIKSAERISDNLSQVVYTSSFFEKTMKAGFNIDQSIFSKDEIKKRKKWSKTVQTQVMRGTGMLNITVYHEDKKQANQIAQAISYVLTEEGWKYVGSNIDITLVDTPLESRWPVKPNIFLNIFTGLILGFFISLVFVFLAYEAHRRRGLGGW